MEGARDAMSWIIIQQEDMRQLDTIRAKVIEQSIGRQGQRKACGVQTEGSREYRNCRKCTEACKDVRRSGNRVAEVGFEYFCLDYVSKNGMSVTEHNKEGRGHSPALHPTGSVDNVTTTAGPIGSMATPCLVNKSVLLVPKWLKWYNIADWHTNPDDDTNAKAHHHGFAEGMKYAQQVRTQHWPCWQKGQTGGISPDCCH